ncbi:hypothetical protein V2J56_09730 [Georgenia sp. MJ206]|uniref:hypothetical protein n=1 Tax=Georgenia wangjunii TaxID=3117730 RepID=UPI002F25FD8F
MPEKAARPPLVLRLALVLVLVEVGAMGALAVSLVVEALAGRAQQMGTTVAMAVFFLGLAVLLVGAIRALHAGRRWGRGPVLTWQLLLLAIGVSQFSLLATWVALVLVVVPVAVAAGLLAPPARAWTGSAVPPRAVV